MNTSRRLAQAVLPVAFLVFFAISAEADFSVTGPRLNGEDLWLLFKGGSTTLTVDGASWRVEITEGKTWLSAHPTSGKAGESFTLTYSSNYQLADPTQVDVNNAIISAVRKAEIVVRSEGIIFKSDQSVTIDVTQSPCTISEFMVRQGFANFSIDRENSTLVNREIVYVGDGVPDRLQGYFMQVVLNNKSNLYAKWYPDTKTAIEYNHGVLANTGPFGQGQPYEHDFVRMVYAFFSTESAEALNGYVKAQYGYFSTPFDGSLFDARVYDVYDADADPDNDGYSNKEEWQILWPLLCEDDSRRRGRDAFDPDFLDDVNTLADVTNYGASMVASWTTPGIGGEVQPPGIGAVSPTAGTTSGGTAVTISGQNLNYPDSVKFDSTSATIVDYSATAIEVLTPVHSAGPVAVTVMTPGGSTSADNAFVYYAQGDLAPPQNVSASDGAYSDKVRVQWDAVIGASSYQVYRSGTNDPSAVAALGPPVMGTTYDDHGASAPTGGSTGCNGGGTATPVYYWYWVKALADDDSESLMSASDRGHRGGGKKSASGGPALAPLTCEQALPNIVVRDCVSVISPSDAVYVRLRSRNPIDPASIEGTVEGTGEEIGVDGWISISDTDGWVVFEPQPEWPVNTDLVVQARCRSLAGDRVDSGLYRFLVKSVVVPDEMSTEVVQPEYGDGEALAKLYRLDQTDTAQLDSGVGPVYRVGPSGAFETPRRIWLPVPDGLAPDSLELCYYTETGTAAGWFRYDEVGGWLQHGGDAIVADNGQVYVGYLLNHGGIVRLATKEDAAISLGGVLPKNMLSGDTLLLVAGLMLCLLLSRKKGRA